jgi:hypothetical protein
VVEVDDLASGNLPPTMVQIQGATSPMIVI